MMRCLVTFLILVAAPLLAHALEWKQTRIEQQAGPLDEQAHAKFQFTNNGDAPVTITDIHTSCGCTVPTLAKRIYEPGESGELEVIFTFNALVGEQTKTITVATDEKDGASHELTFQVDIPKLYELDRHFIVWRRGDALEPKTLDLRILLPDVIKIVGIESKSDRFTGAIEQGEQPGAYTIKITPTSTESVTQASLLVKTDKPAGEPKVITLYALVR
ncbi:MAG: DUF1573 domain-containing protein [Opitutaceae bacterium]